MKVCFNCGKDMSDDAAFCMNCGAKYEEQQPKSDIEQTPIMNESPLDVFGNSETQPKEDEKNENSTFMAQPENDVFSQQPENSTFMAQPENNVFSQQPENGAFMAQPENDVFSQQPENGAFMAQPENNVFSQQPENGAFMAQPENQMNAEMPKKKSKKPFIIGGIIAGIALIAAIVVAIVFFMSGNESIALKDYVKVKVEGIDGYANANVSFDYEKFAEDVAKLYEVDIEKAKSTDSDYKSVKKIVSKITSKLELEISESEDLSNGDEIVVEFKLSDSVKEAIADEGLDVDVTKFKMEVKDLGEVVEIDPFEDVRVEISGIYPNLEASVHNESSDDFISSIYFYVDKIEENKVTVTYSYSGDTLEYGYKFTEKEKIYTFDEYPTYEFTVKDFEQEDIEEYIEDAEDMLLDWIEYNSYYCDDATGFENFKYLGCILEIPENVGDYNSTTLHIAFEADLTGIEEETNEAGEVTNKNKMFVFEIDGAYIDEDGKLAIDGYNPKKSNIKMVDDLKDYVDGLEYWDSEVTYQGDALDEYLEDPEDIEEETETETGDNKETETDDVEEETTTSQE